MKHLVLCYQGLLIEVCAASLLIMLSVVAIFITPRFSALRDELQVVSLRYRWQQLGGSK